MRCLTTSCPPTRPPAGLPCRQHSTCHPSGGVGSPKGTELGEGTTGQVAGQTRLPAPGCGPGTVMPFYLGVSLSFSNATAACDGGELGVRGLPDGFGRAAPWAPE